MEWGIINKENYKDFYDIPIKRWDPLSTVKIKDKDFGASGRFYGHYAYISPIRGSRPKGFQLAATKADIRDCTSEELAQITDVFTAVIEGKAIYDQDGSLIGDGNTIIITEDETRRDDPFSDKPHRIERLSNNTKAITLINRYPSMARVVDQDIENDIKSKLPSYIKLSKGIALVTLSRDFYPSTCFALIPDEVLTAIFLSMKEAAVYCVQQAIERDYYDIPVTPFFNIGTKVGGSQPRIHGQVYIDLNMDGHGSRIEGILEAFKEMGDDCHLCQTTHGESERIILQSDYWIFYATGSPVRNYHIRFHPKEHVRRFNHMNINQFQELSRNLKLLFQALDDLGVDENRNILFNNCPYGYDSDMHVFGDIIPHEVIGGAEMADDMRVARKLPIKVAAEIRDAIEKVLDT